MEFIDSAIASLVFGIPMLIGGSFVGGFQLLAGYKAEGTVLVGLFAMIFGGFLSAFGFGYILLMIVTSLMGG
jgi:hypothetical protein